MKPLVTVIIPSFNHADYVEAAIESVLAQEYENFELIVVDDGSSDGSKAVLSAVPPDPRMTVILNDTNSGQSAVVNQALTLARGEFICLLPSDDWYYPNKLSLQVEKFSQCGPDVGVVYARGLRYFSDTDMTRPVNSPMRKGWVLEYLIREPNFVYPITPMFRRACFEFARPDESYMAEGEAIYLRMALKYKFEYVDEIVGVMRDHSYNTGKMTARMYADNIRYWTEFFRRKDLPESIRVLRKIPIARVHRLKGLESLMLEKNFSAGRSALLQSILMMPTYIFDVRVIAGFLLSLLPHAFADPLINRRVAARSSRSVKKPADSAS